LALKEGGNGQLFSQFLEECPAKDMAATLALSREYVLEAVHLLERLPSTG
jgi:hypothetical protein